MVLVSGECSLLDFGARDGCMLQFACCFLRAEAYR